MSSQKFKLEQLFRRCDTRGTGYIDQKEFRDLCRGFDIANQDADIIFYDLDHDGDGRISFDDFAFGFRDFVTPGSRRGSIQLGLASPAVSRQKSFSYPANNSGPLSVEGGGGAIPEHQNGDGDIGYGVNYDEEALAASQEEKQRIMEKKHCEAKAAWKNFADHLGKDDVNKFLSVSSDKIFTLYEELQTSEAAPHLVNQYEEVISALMADVKKMESETRKMEEKIAKERESHTTHLKNIEAELDAQVARVENQARERARMDHESEKRELQEKMENEMAQLQSQLKIFQKIDTYLNKEKDEHHTKEAQKRLDNAVSENRGLKQTLQDTQTNIALLRAELNQTKSQYEAKCSELNEERENKIEFVYEFDNLNRQLDLMRDANTKLQDTNDGLRSVVDVSQLNSPRMSASRHEFANLMIAPDILRSPSSENELYLTHKKRRNRGYANAGGSRSPSENGGGSVYDSDSMRSRCSSDRPKITDVQFGIKRLMDDLDDSGHSTLPADEYVGGGGGGIGGGGGNRSSTPDLDFETREALNRLEEAVEFDGDLEEDAADEEQTTSRGRSRTAGGANGGRVSPGETPGPTSTRRRRKLGQLDQQDRDSTEIDVADQSKSSSRRGATANGSASQPDGPAPRSASQQRPSANPLVPLNPLSIRDLEPTGPPDRTYKVVFAGDAAVGKTSFINRLTKGVFLSNLSSTLGVDFQVKTIRVDERNIAIQLWDTAGQERFRSVTRSYFRRADGVMLLYDVTSDRSFLSVRQWIEAVDDVSEKRIPIMLCANKVDLRAEVTAGGRRCISQAEGERMGREHSAIFIETSAKDGKNVVEALVQLSRDMCSSEDVEVQTSALKIRDEGKKKNCCSK